MATVALVKYKGISMPNEVKENQHLGTNATALRAQWRSLGVVGVGQRRLKIVTLPPLYNLPVSANAWRASFAWLRFQWGSQVLSSGPYPFHQTRYSTWFQHLLLPKIDSTLYSSTPSTTSGIGGATYHSLRWAFSTRSSLKMGCM